MSITVSQIFIGRPKGWHEVIGTSIVVKQDGDRFAVEIENKHRLVDAINANQVDEMPEEENQWRCHPNIASNVGS